MAIETAEVPPPRLFFIIGPLRTGSSLMARSIDDHEDAICLCETEINRTLFPSFALRLHVQRMIGHGFTLDEILNLLDGRAQGDLAGFFRWYGGCVPYARQRYGKPTAMAFGDKSPDLFKNPALIDEICDKYALIYTVRDPRAIVRSIWRQTDSTEEIKEERWDDLIGNIRAWRPHWDRRNLLATRYEDLVRSPAETMARVYAHLLLPPSTRFLDDFPRLFPERFLWETAVDMNSGRALGYDASRMQVSSAEVPDKLLRRLAEDPDIAAFRERFGYEV